MVIDTHTGLSRFCNELDGAGALFVDTEFIREGRYYPEVGAIQIAAGERAVLVDPLAVRDLSPLLPVLTDSGIDKVFHAADQDLEILYRLLGRPVAPVFDTQIAAALLGHEHQISFVKLVELTTDVRLRKTHGFTDWLRRPLTERQVTYALEDVRYLQPAHAYLVNELRSRGRLEWAREESAHLEDPSRFRPVDPRELFARLQGVERLNPRELARAQELAAWREQTARDMNIPLRRICSDALLLSLARRPRRTVKELRGMRGLRPRQVERFGEGLIDALQRAEDNPVPSLERPAPLPARLEPTVDFLMLCLRSLAANAEVAASLLGTRSDLAQVVLSGDSAAVPLMNGWRREIAGESILKALRGEATARVARDRYQVILEWQHGDDEAAGG